MNEWIRMDDRKPDKFPCKGRNYDLGVEDVIIGPDSNNHAFTNAFYCKSLGKPFSMPFTHWMPLPEAPK